MVSFNEGKTTPFTKTDGRRFGEEENFIIIGEISRRKGRMHGDSAAGLRRSGSRPEYTIGYVPQKTAAARREMNR